MYVDVDFTSVFLVQANGDQFALHISWWELVICYITRTGILVVIGNVATIKLVSIAAGRHEGHQQLVQLIVTSPNDIL